MSLRTRSILAAAALLGIGGSASAQPYGIDTRETNNSIVISDIVDDPPADSFVTQVAYNLALTDPTHVTNAGDGSNRVFVVERAGRIRVFDEDDASPTMTTFLDITGRVTAGGELGLLSVAFHPDYENNGQFYVFYTTSNGSPYTNRISLFFNNTPAGNTADPNSEVILVDQADPFSNHNGGQLQFGEDGFLYAGFGDGGSGDDPNDAGQNMNTLLGKILRIDVDGTAPGLNYAIPTDNPFAGYSATATNVVVESRQPGGALTPAPAYQEFGPAGGFTDSTLKSSFTGSGLTGTGSRTSTNAALTSRARFTPAALEPGLYNVYVTTTNDGTANAGNTTYRINTADGLLTYNIALTSANTGNRWRLIRRNVRIDADTEAYVEIQETATQSGNLFSDAVRFERITAVRPEIYAFGLRNPWRFAPDFVTGTIWVADVGQNDREEVNILRNGGNYGWRDVEGDVCTPGIDSTCDRTGYVNPIKVYPHSGAGDTGCSITGGVVYRGTEFPELYGMYLYTDYCTGWIRGLRWDGSFVTADMRIVPANAANDIVSFGYTESGEMLMASISQDRLMKLARAAGFPAPENDLPLKLSQNAALYDLAKETEVPGVIPYQPRNQFWSDGVHKERHMALPGVQDIQYTGVDGWNFPDDSTIVKNYWIPLEDGNPASEKLVETRLMVRDGSDWRFYSYKWNEDETEAWLLLERETRPFTVQTADGPLEYSYFYPNSSDCQQCHTGAANYTLGISTLTLNCTFTYPTSGVTDNQLRTYDHIGLLDPALPAPTDQLPAIAGVEDTTESLERRAKAWLHTNCAHCHREGGNSPVPWDARWDTDVNDMGLIDIRPSAGDIGIEDAYIIKSGDPAKSVLYERITSLDPAIRMPPLASTRVDEDGARVIRAWIYSLNSSATGEGWMLY